MTWLESTDFPSGQLEGTSYSKYSPWVHPQTKAVYLWDFDKNSWLLFSNTGARMYSMTIDPALDGNTLYDGDMWWDQRALELRVYHRPTPASPGQTVTGRWVSSTNPEMSLVDTNRNNIIGIIELDAPTSDIYEGREVMFSVSRPYGGAPDYMIDYEWIVNPNPAPVNYEPQPGVIINSPDQATTTMIFEVGTHIMDGDQQLPFNVYCKVSAKEEYADSFVKSKDRSEQVTVYPMKQIVDPIDYYQLIDTQFGLGVADGSQPASNEGNTYKIGAPLIGNSFFMIPSDDVVSNHTGLTFTLTDPADGEVDQENIVGSVYMAATGPINDIYPDVSAGNPPSGFTITLSDVNYETDTVIYIVSESEPTYRTTLTVTAK